MTNYFDVGDLTVCDWWAVVNQPPVHNEFADVTKLDDDANNTIIVSNLLIMH